MTDAPKAQATLAARRTALEAGGAIVEPDEAFHAELNEQAILEGGGMRESKRHAILGKPVRLPSGAEGEVLKRREYGVRLLVEWVEPDGSIRNVWVDEADAKPLSKTQAAERSKRLEAERAAREVQTELALEPHETMLEGLAAQREAS